MINKYYRQAALNTYGHQCELCGHSMVEVHHIDYQEQQDMERKLRLAEKKQWEVTFPSLITIAKQAGYLEYRNNQLSKNDHTSNLAVLCGNCHGLIHLMDVGLKLLKAIKERK